MNLAYRFPIIYWNTACLIVDSGGIIEAPDDNEESDDKKKAKKTTAFGKIATAIGKMQARGVTIAPPDINNASYSFTPNEENNIIYYGLSGIVKIGRGVINNILMNRPYTSWKDFLSKVKVNKAQMVNLIKSGAFDSLGDRMEIMKEYISSICGKKSRLTLQNLGGLISYGLVPEKYDFEVRVYNFNKYLKKNKYDKYYILDDIAYSFFEKNYDVDLLEEVDGKTCILQTKWDFLYQKSMDVLRNWLSKCKEKKLEEYNNILEKESWDKYCEGNLSKWEMDSVSFYSHDHELKGFKANLYGVKDFERLPKEPRVETYIYIKDKKIPLFQIDRIAGTVLDKDKTKNIITLLTPSGVVPVKLFGPVFTNYDKQISEKGANGKKSVLEKSWFTRGNKLIFTGIRRGESFFAKKYKKTPYHLCEKIEEIYDDGTVSLLSNRYGEIEE